MTRQVQDAYIVAATRTPIGKAPRGVFRHVRPDDLLVHTIRASLAQVPDIDPVTIEDAIIARGDPIPKSGPALGLRDLKWLRPVYVGDTLYPMLQVTELKSGRTTGVAVLKLTIHNQKGELVCDGEHKYLLKKKPQ